MSSINKKCYYEKDFEDKFKVTHLMHSILVDERLKKWDIKKDKEYTINPVLNDQLEKRYGSLIEIGYTAKMSVKLVNKQVGYGAYAEQLISKGDMICEYTGIVEQETYGSDNLYLWDYPTILFEKTASGRRKKITFCVNAEKSGNIARFINHSLRKYQNVGIELIPFDGSWHVVYLAKRDIYPGEQLLTYYGTQYWRDRNIVPFTILPTF